MAAQIRDETGLGGRDPEGPARAPRARPRAAGARARFDNSFLSRLQLERRRRRWGAKRQGCVFILGCVCVRERGVRSADIILTLSLTVSSAVYLAPFAVVTGLSTFTVRCTQPIALGHSKSPSHVGFSTGVAPSERAHRDLSIDYKFQKMSHFRPAGSPPRCENPCSRAFQRKRNMPP